MGEVTKFDLIALVASQKTKARTTFSSEKSHVPVIWIGAATQDHDTPQSRRIKIFRDCSKDTGFIQPVHDAVMRGVVDGLHVGLLATYPAPSVH